MMKGYIYLRFHFSYILRNITLIKLGGTSNPVKREPTYKTGEPEKGNYLKIFEVLDWETVEALLQESFKEYHYNGSGGNEFYNFDIIHMIEDRLIELGFDYKEVDIADINKECRKLELQKRFIKNLKKNTRVKKYHRKLDELKRKREKSKRDKRSIKDEIKWFEREYQTKIIDLGLNKLSELGKFYLELATGAGKTYIVFKILNKLNPDIIFCLSPRLKINTQNIGKKYLSILGEEYEVFNLSSDDNIDEFMRKGCKKVIIGCTSKGCDKIKDIINTYHLENISLWIDECHWGIEGWITNGLSENQEYLLESRNIKYRIYTSASPNIEKVENNENIFGELFKEITVKQLMEQGWLCNIKPFVFEVKEYSINYCKTILKDFKKYERSWGLSFHTSCLNSFNIFLKHYEDYKLNNTLIKPYLLIGDSKDINNDRRINTIDLDYDYRCFKSYEDNRNSIAYVVKKCDMGYDFENIDYISLTDKKMSYSDLIQCIGRGLRSDKMGENGKNLKKELYLMIPNYIDEDNSDNYDNLINVIQYLQYDIGLEWKDIPFRSCNSGSSRSGNTPENYNGEKIIQSKLMNAMRLRKVNWTIKKLIIYCKNNNIHNIEEYINYIKDYPSLNLPDGDNPLGFNWSETYRKHNYYTKEECIEKIKNIMEENDINDDDEEIDYYHNIDNKIPDMYLVDFYGGFRNDYPCY